MRRATAAMGLLVLWGVVGPGAPAAEASQLALPILTGAQKPELTLAQRVIEREWGPSEDSVYVVVDVPGWREEAYAMGLSAAAPGSPSANRPAPSVASRSKRAASSWSAAMCSMYPGVRERSSSCSPRARPGSSVFRRGRGGGLDGAHHLPPPR